MTSNSPKIALIWAMSRNGVIGKDNTLPWKLPLDMKHFMTTTLGKPVIMGRKTLESMKAPLPGRTNIVLTTNTSYVRDGVEVVHSLDEALSCARTVCAAAEPCDEIMVIGGADIYALALPVADRLYITHVKADIEGDVYFPELNLSDWQLVSETHHEQDDRHTAPFTIAQYERT